MFGCAVLVGAVVAAMVRGTLITRRQAREGGQPMVATSVAPSQGAPSATVSTGVPPASVPTGLVRPAPSVSSGVPDGAGAAPEGAR